MGRRAKWRNRLHSIKEQIERSKTQVWLRKDIEDLFEVKHTSGKKLIRATAKVANVGRVYMVDKQDLLNMVDRLIQGDDSDKVLGELYDKAPPAPEPTSVRVALPDFCKNVTLEELPSNIQIGPGRLEVTGDALMILKSLIILGEALKGPRDLEEAITIWNSTPVTDQKLVQFIKTLRRQFNPDGSRTESTETYQPKEDVVAADAAEEIISFITTPIPWLPR
jgi:hypothetical protein